MFRSQSTYFILFSFVLALPISLAAAPLPSRTIASLKAKSVQQKHDPILVLTDKTENIRINDYLMEIAVLKGSLTSGQAVSEKYRDRYRLDASRSVTEDDAQKEYWLRLRIQNKSKKRDWHLRMDWPYLMKREFYLERNNRLLPLEENKSRNRPSAKGPRQNKLDKKFIK